MATFPRAERMGPRTDRKRDPQETRLRVLDVARSEFAKNGFAGARVDAIALRARVNKQALYYHFGSKERLFKAALDSGYQAFRALDRKLNLSVVTPKEAVVQLITANFDYLHKSPELLAMIMDANRHKGRLLNRGGVRAINAPLVGAISSILSRGEREGSFRPGITSDQFFLSFISLVTFYFTNNYTLSAVLGRNLMNPMEVRTRRAHIVELLLRYISNT